MANVEARVFAKGEVAWLFTVFLLVSGGGCRDDAASDAPVAKAVAFPASQNIEIKINRDTFTEAAVCGACHQAIHAYWNQSMHSRAFTNGVFQAAYRATKEAYSEERSRLCLGCHAPTVSKTQDYAAQNPITREGVTCDFCHSIRSVNLAVSEKRIDLNVGWTKYGPLKHAQSPAHGVVDSGLHRSSELCASCHEYRNEHGVAILETYSEWKSSLYAEQGKQCQDCHMPLVGARVVALGVTDQIREQVNLHDISGSHDMERVRQAVTMKILSVERLGDKKVLARISVNNVGSGHCFPTGLPKHRAVLEVNLTDRGRLVARRSIEFAKVLLNDKGMPISREDEMFFEARSIRSDTRLRPKEERVVTLTFYDVKISRGQIEASLSYQYSTNTVRRKGGVEVIEPTEMKFLIASQKRTFPGAGR